MGKTTLFRKFAFNTIDQDYYLFSDYFSKNVEIKQTITRFMLFDTMNSERRRAIPKAIYRIVNGIILAYDITSRDSFNHIDYWKKECEKHSQKDLKFVLVGLKCELSDQREVRREEGESLAISYNIPFFEVSSFEDTNVECIFINLFDQFQEKPKAPDHSENILAPQTRNRCG